MITEAQQHTILSTVRSLTSGEGKASTVVERERHLLLIGVMIGLGTEALPPIWVINIQSGRTDRLFK